MPRIGRGRTDTTEKAVTAAHANWAEPSTFGRQAIVASATRIDIPTASKQRRKAVEADWQAEAWHHYNRSGELQYAATWMANSLSRIRIFAAEVGKDGRPGKPTEQVTAQKIAYQMFGGPIQRSQLMAQLGVHLTVPGDCFIVAETDPQSNLDDWYIVSTSELVKRNGELGIDRGDGWRPLDSTTTVLIRVWNPHPQRYEEATSATRAVLPVLRELEKLDQHVHATLESRLPAGILFLPDNISFRAPGVEQQAATGSVDAFMTMLTEAMVAAIEDRDSPASLVPITVKVPAEAMASVQHISFGNDLIAAVAAMREACIRRLALGLDMPPEQLLGMGDSNHWCTPAVYSEAYTKDRGWVHEDQLTVGEEILTLNHETGLAEWSPVLDIYRAEVIDEPMLRLSSRAHRSLSTAGHRWPIVKTGAKVAGSRRRWTTSGEGFAAADRVPMAAPLAEDVLERKYDDDFVRLVAAYTSDGSLLWPTGGVRPIARIVKFDEREIAELRGALTRLLGHAPREHSHPTATVTGTAFVLTVEPTAALVEVTGEHKVIRRGFVNDLTLSQRALLLDAMIDLGDGVRNASADTFYQVEPARLDALEQAALSLGRKVSRGVRNQQTGFGETPLSWLRVSRTRTEFAPRECASEWTTFTGRIWCPRTANGTWLARTSDGIGAPTVGFTGNSSWQIEEGGVKVHVEPKAITVCAALTESYFRPALRAAGVVNPEDYCLWYDVTELILRPNRGEAAKKLAEMDALSEDVMLREAGFDPATDKPSAEEFKKRVLMDLLMKAPNFAAGILPHLGIEDVAIPLLEPYVRGKIPPAISDGPVEPQDPIKGKDEPKTAPRHSGDTRQSRPQTPANGPDGDADPQPSGPSPTHAMDLAREIAVEGLVSRGLEFANKKLLTRGRRGTFDGDIRRFYLDGGITVNKDQVLRLLDGAWTYLPEVADSVALDPRRLEAALADHVGGLLVTGQEHLRRYSRIIASGCAVALAQAA